VTESPRSHTLNVDITLAELLQALKKLQKNKATGLDGMKVKFILDAGELLHMPLLTAFNCFLTKGFPEALSTGVVHALFKGGDASKFDNYRGIMVGPILAKLFVMILDKRLSKWAEQHGLRAKGQARFRKDYRTTDQLFILRTLIEQSKAKKKPLYFYFVDLKKAFDTVPHEVLWQMLVGLGVKGTLLVMSIGDVCQGYHTHQPPKRGCHLQLQVPARCETRLSFQPPVVWVIFGCPKGAFRRQRM